MKTISIKILTLFIFFFIATALLAALVVGAGAAFVHGDQSKKMTTAECLADETCHETVLNRIETRMGTLAYQAGFPTKSTVESIYNEMDYQRAVLAHQISDNLVSYYSMHVGPLTAIKGAKMGDLVVWEKFLDTKGIVLTGNDTTVYGMAYLDLKKTAPWWLKCHPHHF